jgi:preprotein translocase subunit SecA
MLQLISKLFGGSKSEKDVKKIQYLVPIINSHFEGYKALSNDALREKTPEFKARIKAHLSAMDAQIESEQARAEALPMSELMGRDTIYQDIDKIKKDRDQAIEAILWDILPEAFAVVKEAARRFTESEQLVSKAAQLDRDLSVRKEYISIMEEDSVFETTWKAAGAPITWNMVHYDVQLIGGIVLHQGKISEMSTGEGKTLVSTLPAYLNALAGEGVHIVTVNDYLAKRDSEWNGTLFEWLGLTVDCIDKHQPNSEERRTAYRADIIYGTNNEFGFDYLRDNMVHTPEEMVQGKHHFAMVDEVDSVLIDDARTPLIISGPIGHQTGEQQFFELKPRIEKLVEVQKKMVNQFLIEAKKKISEGNDDAKDGGMALYRAFRGLPKNSALIKYLSEPGIRVKLQKSENYFLADQQREMYQVDEELYFHIDEKNNQVELTEKGLQLITKSGEDPNFFLLPDISVTLNAIDQNVQLSADEKIKEKETIIADYSIKADRIHTVNQLLKAYTLFDNDVEYVVIDGQVKIVDEQTGRIMEGRRYSDGLHQAIEAKENVKIEAASQTYATITLQNFFRMYHKLAGMTGTAETEASEFWSIYKLDVVSIPTNIPAIRKDEQDLVFKTKREKFGAVIEAIEDLRDKGRPVLVGTTSVEVSELLSRMLRQKNIPHNVLNAKQHAREAQVVAEAGLTGAVTIATNMAGRGTDIKLSPEVKAAGGLAILGTERHESRRVDRQLRGRAGRQGDPGSSQFFVSLEDDLMRMFGSERIAKVMDFAGYKEGEVIQHSMITKSIERAQRKVEENNFGTRKRLLEYDDVMNKQRAVIYRKRSHALFGERLALDIDNAFYQVLEGLVFAHKTANDYEAFKLGLIVHGGIDTKVTAEDFKTKNENELAELVYQEALAHYEYKKGEIMHKSIPVFKNIRLQQGKHIENVIVPVGDGKIAFNVLVNLDKNISTGGNALVSQAEKSIALSLIDDAWKEHLRAMDDLKQSVQNATYEQKDPLVIYKMEAFELFKKMDMEINHKLVQFLCHVHLPIEEDVREGRQQKTDLSKLSAGRTEEGTGEKQYHDPSEAKQTPIQVGPKIGRNDPCPCGSGKKYKACHGRDADS